MTDVEDRYLAGEVDFESAAADALDTPSIDRRDLLPLLHALRVATHPAASLAAHEADLLDAGGAPESPLALAIAVADRTARMRRLLDSALTVEQAAERLGGVGASRVRQRVGDRSLWAIKRANRLLLPAVQFTDDGQVPGLDAVLRALPENMQPLSIHGLLTTPQPSLVVDGAPNSVLDWLLTGGTVEDALSVVDQYLAA
ncbi:DNA-binding protein [Rhodococcus sp. DMU1]|uniref:DNA-binding protein n=1 Tax=Rhodococcus sp. DMU1 TaxID=2722825 RepID=UPI00143E6306|nr:DNA-binding protein [Rhodococcus sp. DMU1]QIX53889.1 DNA-binding protein [Rhodococcus sp. DMU1]